MNNLFIKNLILKNHSFNLISVLIGSLSTTVTLFLSPIVVAICRRKSIRLMAILGGLITALGCLFTSFATQFHQLFFSYGLVVAIGVSMIRDSSVIMIGQYFKRRREFVEIFVLSGSGLGIALMPLFLSCLIRPASLYHPQRRAILHIKSLQKRSRLKAHKKVSSSASTATSVDAGIEKPSYFDFSVMKSKTIQILICGTCISNFGISAPLFL
ncbi:monocarboxylate transporter 12-B-like protein, partial [Leptotrombidium deliense]